MRRMAYLVSMWLLRHSGDAGANAWRDMRDRAAKSEADYYAADRERWSAVKRLQTFREAVQRADSMISAGMSDKAQQTIRVALIASRDVSPAAARLPMPMHGMSGIHL